MPLTVPPFSQFQGVLFPLRGLWNKAPAEGDRFINAEIDWATQNTQAVQFSLSGNSPVALSQIVALYVDNRRCGVDCDFLFPDSGFLLTVPGRAQGLFPVLTNALMFYAIATGAGAADVTILQILNSLPPPIPLIPTSQQNTGAITGITVANGTTQIVPATVSGSLNTISLSLDLLGGASGGSLNIALQDGTGVVLWENYYNVAANQILAVPVNLGGLNIRFLNGIRLVQSGLSGTLTGTIAANVYYS